MTHHTKPMLRLIDALRDEDTTTSVARYDTPRPDMGQFADLRDGGNIDQPRRFVSGWWIIPSAVLGGMILAAALVHADPIGRTADTVANPHLEGF